MLQSLFLLALIIISHVTIFLLANVPDATTPEARAKTEFLRASRRFIIDDASALTSACALWASKTAEDDLSVYVDATENASVHLMERASEVMSVEILILIWYNLMR